MSPLDGLPQKKQWEVALTELEAATVQAGQHDLDTRPPRLGINTINLQYRKLEKEINDLHNQIKELDASDGQETHHEDPKEERKKKQDESEKLLKELIEKTVAVMQGYDPVINNLLEKIGWVENLGVDKIPAAERKNFISNIASKRAPAKEAAMECLGKLKKSTAVLDKLLQSARNNLNHRFEITRADEELDSMLERFQQLQIIKSQADSGEPVASQSTEVTQADLQTVGKDFKNAQRKFAAAYERAATETYFSRNQTALSPLIFGAPKETDEERQLKLVGLSVRTERAISIRENNLDDLLRLLSKAPNRFDALDGMALDLNTIARYQNHRIAVGVPPAKKTILTQDREHYEHVSVTYQIKSLNAKVGALPEGDGDNAEIRDLLRGMSEHIDQALPKLADCFGEFSADIESAKDRRANIPPAHRQLIYRTLESLYTGIAGQCESVIAKEKDEGLRQFFGQMMYDANNLAVRLEACNKGLGDVGPITDEERAEILEQYGLSEFHVQPKISPHDEWLEGTAAIGTSKTGEQLQPKVLKRRATGRERSEVSDVSQQTASPDKAEGKKAVIEESEKIKADVASLVRLEQKLHKDDATLDRDIDNLLRMEQTDRRNYDLGLLAFHTNKPAKLAESLATQCNVLAKKCWDLVDDGVDIKTNIEKARNYTKDAQEYRNSAANCRAVGEYWCWQKTQELIRDGANQDILDSCTNDEVEINGAFERKEHAEPVREEGGVIIYEHVIKIPLRFASGAEYPEHLHIEAPHPIRDITVGELMNEQKGAKIICSVCKTTADEDLGLEYDVHRKTSLDVERVRARIQRFQQIKALGPLEKRKQKEAPENVAVSDKKAKGKKQGR